jgi:hypothetical protein
MKVRTRQSSLDLVLLIYHPWPCAIASKLTRHFKLHHHDHHTM